MLNITVSFDYYRHKSSDPIKQSFYDSIYEAIQTDRYIYLTDIGYFTIKNSNDSDEDNIDKKSITCKSCEENEFAIAEGLHLKEGTYYLHTDNSDGLLDLFLPKTAGWTMGYIDPSLLTKPYFVEDTEVDNGYNFLYTTIQNMFECIVEPDIIKRTISVCSRVYYTEHHLTDIHIAKYNLLKHKTVEENDEDKYTALNVQGKDENLEIRAINPTGKNVIYNFEPRYAWMSKRLQEAIEKWQEKCESVENRYLELQQGYYAELEKLFNEEKDIEVLKGELEQLKETKDIAFTMADGDEKDQSLNNVNKAITAKQSEINTATSNYNDHKAKVKTDYEVPIEQINKDCALDTTAVDINGNTIFTADLLNELMTHIKPTDYVDEYMLVTESMTYPQRFEKAKELMDRAQSQLVKISSGQKTYSIDTRSFLFNKQFKYFSEQLCAGAIIYVETKSDTMEQLHLTGIDINFDEKSTNFTLGNKYDRSDLKALYEDALGQNSKSFSELKYIASIIEDQQKQLDYQRNWVADLRTLTLDNVLTSEDQAIEINNRGLIGRKRKLDENGEWDFDENGNPYFEEEQVKLINNTLVFTEDNWDTASTAVGKIAVGYDSKGNVKYAYGINGQVLIGELILGNNLVLTGTGAGIKITDNNGNNVFYADDEGNLVLSGTIFANKGNIAGWQIESNQITKVLQLSDGYNRRVSMASDVNFPAFYVTESTPEHSIFAVNWDGSIKATSGFVGGWDISGGCLESFQSNVGRIRINSNASNRTDNWIEITTANWEDESIPFKVTRDGILHANGAVINGSGTFSGTITANSGSIDGWKIGDGVGIYYNSGTTGCGFIGKTEHANIAIYAGANTQNIGTAPFRVYHDGSLVATNATITGTINATSGIFDNCTINKTCTITKIEATEGSVGGWNVHYDAVRGGHCLQGYTNSLNWVLLTPNILYGSDGGYVKEAPWYNIATVCEVGSDKNIKDNILNIGEKYDKVFDSLLPITFNYSNDVKSQLHFGFVAQDVLKSFSDISVNNFAGLWKNEYYNLNKQEFIALNTWQIQKTKKRITDLENTVAELKTQIQILTAG